MKLREWLALPEGRAMEDLSLDLSTHKEALYELTRPEMVKLLSWLHTGIRRRKTRARRRWARLPKSVDCYGLEYIEGSMYEMFRDDPEDFVGMFGKAALSEVRGREHSRHGMWFCLQDVCRLLGIEPSEVEDVLDDDEWSKANNSPWISVTAFHHLIVDSSSSVPGAIRFRAWADRVFATESEHGQPDAQ